MADAVDTYIDQNLLAVEGAYVNNPADKGGPTRWGVTQEVARANGYPGDMQTLPRDAAHGILRSEYFTKPHLDRVWPLSQRVAMELLDCGVNQGTGTAIRFAQRALNVLNRQARDYPDIAVDGAIGDAFIRSLTDYLHIRGSVAETTLLKVMVCLRGAHYVEIGEARAADEEFEEGWFENRIHL